MAPDAAYFCDAHWGRGLVRVRGDRIVAAPTVLRKLIGRRIDRLPVGTTLTHIPEERPAATAPAPLPFTRPR